MLFVLLVFASPAQDKHFLFITYPGGVNALVALVSFGVSGIYLSFLMTVIAAWVARARGWVPEGRFTLGRWGTTVTVIATLYLGLMLINVVLPTGLSSPRAYFNLDWITLLVMFVIAVVGAIYFFTARPDRGVRHHLHDDLEPTGAERELPPRRRARESLVSEAVESVVRTMQERLDGLTPEQAYLREFLGTYQRTTLAVGKAVDAGEFEDPEWVERVGRRVRRAVRRRPSTPTSAAVDRRATLAARLRRAARPAGAAPRAPRHQRARQLRPAAGAAGGHLATTTSPTPSLMASRRRDHERIDGVLASRVAAEDAELAVHGRSLTDRLLQPLNRLSSKRFLRESRMKVWHNTAELQPPASPAPRRTTCGWASWRCSAPPGSPTCSRRDRCCCVWRLRASA